MEAQAGEALGAGVGVITAIIPEAALLLGNVPMAEESALPDESHKRFIYVFRKFVRRWHQKSSPSCCL